MTLTGHNTTTWVTPPWVRSLPGVDCPNGCTQRIRDAREADAVPWCGECTPPGFAVVCWKPGEERTLLLSRKDWVRRGEVTPNDVRRIFVQYGYPTEDVERLLGVVLARRDASA